MEFVSLPAIYDTAFQFRNAQTTVDFIEHCAEMYTDIPVESIVEFACGTGFFTVEFARRGYHAYGVDIDEAMCRYAARRGWNESLELSIFHADMTEVALPRPCDLAVNLFDSLTYLTDKQRVIAHLKTAAKALRPGGLYLVEIGLIDDFVNHNVKDIWTETRGECAITTSYLRHGEIDPENNTFTEECVFSIACRQEASYLVLKNRKLALRFDEFIALVEQSGCFLPLVFFDDFNADAFLPENAQPWRVIAVLLKI